MLLDFTQSVYTYSFYTIHASDVWNDHSVLSFLQRDDNPVEYYARITTSLIGSVNYRAIGIDFNGSIQVDKRSTTKTQTRTLLLNENNFCLSPLIIRDWGFYRDRYDGKEISYRKFEYIEWISKLGHKGRARGCSKSHLNMIELSPTFNRMYYNLPGNKLNSSWIMDEVTIKFAIFRICLYILNQKRSTPTEKLKNRRTYGKILLRFERGIHISMKNYYFHNFDKQCYLKKYQVANV